MPVSAGSTSLASSGHSPAARRITTRLSYAARPGLSWSDPAPREPAVMKTMGMRRRVRHGLNDRNPEGHNGDVAPREVGHRQPFRAVLAEAIFDDDVFPLDIAASSRIMLVRTDCRRRAISSRRAESGQRRSARAASGNATRRTAESRDAPSHVL